MSKEIRLPGVAAITEQQDLPAGRFSTWLRRTRSSQINDNGADVQCGDCNACCQSSYFIHVGPEETRTLAHIPAELLFAAPGKPRGTVLLGYDENGHCPMLIDNACSIYEHRPLACSSYDCRIFAAAAIAPAEDHKALITQRAQCWKFSYLTDRDRNQQAALQAAAAFLQQHAEYFTAEIPNNSTQLAMFAIKIYDLFLRHRHKNTKTGRVAPDLKVAKALIRAYRKFEAGRMAGSRTAS